MKICQNCKTPLEDYVKFCPVCGIDLPTQQSYFKPQQELTIPNDLFDRQQRMDLSQQYREEKIRERGQERLEKMQQRLEETQFRRPSGPIRSHPIIPTPAENKTNFLEENKGLKIENRELLEQKRFPRCSLCGNQLNQFNQDDRWYCQKCKRYEYFFIH